MACNLIVGETFLREMEKKMKIPWIIAIMIFCFASSISTHVKADSSAGLPPELEGGIQELSLAGVDERQVHGLTQSMSAYPFAIEEIVDVHRLMITAHRQALPIAPLIEKAYEGMTKRVPASGILPAMHKVYERYAFAESQIRQLNLALDTRGHAQARKAMVDGLAAGVTTADMQMMTRNLQTLTNQSNAAASQDLVAATLTTARDMARTGASSQAIGQVVDQALRHNYSARDMQTMRTNFMERARTRSATKTAGEFAVAIGKGTPASELGAMTQGVRPGARTGLQPSEGRKGVRNDREGRGPGSAPGRGRGHDGETSGNQSAPGSGGTSGGGAGGTDGAASGGDDGRGGEGPGNSGGRGDGGPAGGVGDDSSGKGPGSGGPGPGGGGAGAGAGAGRGRG